MFQGWGDETVEENSSRELIGDIKNVEGTLEEAAYRIAVVRPHFLKLWPYLELTMSNTSVEIL